MAIIQSLPLPVGRRKKKRSALGASLRPLNDLLLVRAIRVSPLQESKDCPPSLPRILVPSTTCSPEEMLRSSQRTARTRKLERGNPPTLGTSKTLSLSGFLFPLRGAHGRVLRQRYSRLLTFGSGGPELGCWPFVCEPSGINHRVIPFPPLLPFFPRRRRRRCRRMRALA